MPLSEFGIGAMRPLAETPVQPYISNSIQLIGVIEWVLGQTGPARVAVSTYSTSEDFLRRIHRLKKSGLVVECRLICDLRAARKTLVLHRLVKAVADSARLCENHSKVILFSNNLWKVAVVTSQNQTRGDRYEAGIVTTDHAVFALLQAGFEEMAKASISIDGILPGDN